MNCVIMFLSSQAMKLFICTIRLYPFPKTAGSEILFVEIGDVVISYANARWNVNVYLVGESPLRRRPSHQHQEKNPDGRGPRGQHGAEGQSEAWAEAAPPAVGGGGVLPSLHGGGVFSWDKATHSHSNDTIRLCDRRRPQNILPSNTQDFNSYRPTNVTTLFWFSDQNGHYLIKPVITGQLKTHLIVF